MKHESAVVRSDVSVDYSPSHQLDLEQVILILRRRKLLIIGCILLVLLAMAVYTFSATPRYTAALQLLFGGKSNAAFNFEAWAEGQPQDEASIISEIEVIKSRTIAQRVVDRLGLADDPEFNNQLRPPGPISRFVNQDAVQYLLSWFPKQSTDTEIPAERMKQYQHQRIIDEVISRIEAKQLPRSRAVTVSFTSNRPDIAAEVVNVIANTYLVARLEDKFENAQRASDWLAAKVQYLREEVVKSERAVEDYRKKHDLLKTERDSLLSSQILDLSGKLTDATIAKLAAQANLARVRQLLPSADRVETASQVLQSALVQRFREEEMDLERREAQLNEQLGPRHPAMIQLEAEKRRFQQKIKSEINKIVGGLENDLEVARSREVALTEDREAFKRQMEQANDASVGLNSLQRTAEANRLLLEKFSTAFMETSAQEDVQSRLPDVRIISPAPIPEKPSFPKTTLLLATALVVGALVGACLAFAIEFLDAGFRSAEQVEEATGLPVLAHVPRPTIAKRRGEDVVDYILRHPKSAAAEAVRSIFTRLMLLSPGDRVPQVVLLVSAVAEEGKTTVALTLARQQAQSGRRVVLIDTDFRRSRIARTVQGVAQSPGLSEFLTGIADAKAVIQLDPKSTVSMVVAGGRALEHFNSDDAGKLHSLIGTLRQDYDLIIIDSAPLAALTDASLIARAADATLMIVRWGHTRRRVALYALSQFATFGGRISGVILTQVNVKAHATYAYGDAGCYYGPSAKYYLG